MFCESKMIKFLEFVLDWVFVPFLALFGVVLVVFGVASLLTELGAICG